MRCEHCGETVPAGAFCGHCGAHLTPRPGDGPAWLRPDGLFAAPHETIFRPSLASSLLPQLSELTRRPFNAGLLLITVSMAVLVELQLPGGLITVASLGLPMLVAIYWRRSRVFDDIPSWAIWLTVVLAIGLAVGWVLLTGDLVLRVAASPFDAGPGGRRVLRQGFGVSDGGAVMMLIPIGAVRLAWQFRHEARQRQCLDGFVIGVLGALVFTSAATLTRLAPQFITAPIARNQPVQWLFFEAAIRGVTVPLTAACFGGLFGTALWFSRPRSTSRFNGPVIVAAVMLCALAILATYAALGWADIEGNSQVRVLSWHIAMALFAVVALRVGLQVAVLHEATPPPPGTPLLCLHCRQVVPEMGFCPSCGASHRASPGRSRTERRNVRPQVPESDSQQGDSLDHELAVWPGYAVPAGTYTAARISRQSPLPMLTHWLAGMAALSAVFVGVPALTVKPPARYNCPPDCGNPPSGNPVSTNPRFTAPGGSFSVAYPAPGTAYDVTTDPSGVTARFTAGDGGELRLTSEPASGRTAREVAEAFIAAKFPTAHNAYEIPNAMVGFQPGFGEIADVFPLYLETSATRMRSVVIVAVKNDLALIAAAYGPYHQFGPKFGPGRPSPANVEIAQDMGRYVNSFQWLGDPPR